MTDFSQAVKSNSDQLNAGDIIKPRVIVITDIVDKQRQDPKQPMWIDYEGSCGSPYKPSLGMRKIILSIWGDGQHLDIPSCIGRQLEVYNESSVKYAGKEVGGIWICGMSDIEGGFTAKIKKNRSQMVDVKIRKLELMERAIYPEEQFNSSFEAMKAAMESGKSSLQTIVAHLQKTGDLTQSQLAQLKQAAPIENDENEEPI